MANKIQFRRDTASNWTSVNPTLSQGELGYETDTTKYKIGDGTTAWTSLSYFSGYTDADVDTHLNTSTASNGEYLSWDGSDYDWATVPAGYTNSDVDTHLNTSTATSGEVLSWTGTDYDWITAGGGGGADLYDANELSPNAQPSATGDNAIAIGDSATSTNLNSVAFGAETKSLGNRTAAIGWRAYASGNDAIALATDDNGGTYGAKGGNSWAVLARSQATGSYTQAIGHYTVASGNYSIALGRNATASHIDSIVIGESASSSAGDQITLGHTDQTVRISSSYTLPQTDGTANQVLTTNGSGAVTFADAGGGGITTGKAIAMAMVFG